MLSGEDAQYMRAMTESLFMEGAVGRVRYTNTLLSGPDVSDTLDPDFVLKPRIGAGYWPGEGLDGHSYAATMLETVSNFNPLEEQKTLRQFILAAHIGEAALARYDELEEANPQVRDFRRQFGPLLMPATIDRCVANRAPFSYLLKGTVVQSELIRPGTQQAFLYYPLGITPKNALASLRGAVKRAQKEEMI